LQRAVRARGHVFWPRLTVIQRARPYRGARRQRPAKLVPAVSRMGRKRDVRRSCAPGSVSSQPSWSCRQLLRVVVAIRRKRARAFTCDASSSVLFFRRKKAERARNAECRNLPNQEPEPATCSAMPALRPIRVGRAQRGWRCPLLSILRRVRSFRLPTEIPRMRRCTKSSSASPADPIRRSTVISNTVRVPAGGGLWRCWGSLAHRRQ